MAGTCVSTCAEMQWPSHEIKAVELQLDGLGWGQDRAASGFPLGGNSYHLQQGSA